MKIKTPKTTNAELNKFANEFMDILDGIDARINGIEKLLKSVKKEVDAMKKSTSHKTLGKAADI